MDLETRLEVRDSSEKVRQRGHDSVKIEVGVVRSNIRRKRPGPFPRFLARVRRTHVAGVEKATEKCQ